MKVSFRKSEEDVIASIQRGDSKSMEEAYLRYRKEFVKWSMGKFGISEDDALDHYQDTMTIFFEKVMNGTLFRIDSSLKTYLFGIGKNKVRQQFDKEHKIEKHGEGLVEHYRFLAEDGGAAEAYEEAKAQTKKMFAMLGDACKELLKLFYFDKRSMSEIAKMMNHKGEGVTRTTKKRCLEKLRSQATKPLSDG